MKLEQFVNKGRTLLGTERFQLPNDEPEKVRTQEHLEAELKKRGQRPRQHGMLGNLGR